MGDDVEVRYEWTLADGSAVRLEPGAGVVNLTITLLGMAVTAALPVATGDAVGAALFKAGGSARQNLAHAVAARSGTHRTWND
jgi:hypothetical protein